MRWNSKKNKEDKNLEYEVAEAIAAFMKSGGGTLIIGQDDKRQTIGIENEYAHMPHKTKDVDAFLLRLSEVILNRIEPSVAHLVAYDIKTQLGHDICVISINSSAKPVFVKKNGIPLFVIREGPRTRKLSAKEQHEYMSPKFSG